MARRLVIVCALLGWTAVPALGGGPAPGSVVEFDFDALPNLRFSSAITDYMSEVYGSPITVEGARTYSEGFGGSDIFIGTSLQLIGRGDFEILFLETPITAARFEGHVLDATIGDDFEFKAFSGIQFVTSIQRNEGVEVFDQDWVYFSQPVDRIIVSDTGRKDVGIDDFAVQVVPEPATFLLLASGVAFAGRRRCGR